MTFVRYIQEHTRVPVLGHAEGLCHAYVDQGADLARAVAICYDAKVQYPAVCNAVETVLVHRHVAAEFLPLLAKVYDQAGVEMRGCPETQTFLPEIAAASEQIGTRSIWTLLCLSAWSIAWKRPLPTSIVTVRGHTDTIITEERRGGSAVPGAGRFGYGDP